MKTRMRHNLIFIPFLFLLATISSCRKNDTSAADCSSDAVTSRKITGKTATVSKFGPQCYIVEEGSIDTKLKPCNLATDFQVDKLRVIISGDVKGTLIEQACCTEIFVITKISR